MARWADMDTNDRVRDLLLVFRDVCPAFSQEAELNNIMIGSWMMVRVVNRGAEVGCRRGDGGQRDRKRKGTQLDQSSPFFLSAATKPQVLLHQHQVLNEIAPGISRKSNIDTILVFRNKGMLCVDEIANI